MSCQTPEIVLSCLIQITMQLYYTLRWFNVGEDLAHGKTDQMVLIQYTMTGNFC